MIYFVTEKRLKDFTTTLGNVDTKLFMPLIPNVAEMWIKPRTGTYFFNHLLDAYNNETLTNEEKEVVSLIQNSLIWRITSDLILTSSLQITNKGPQQQSGDNSTSPSTTHLGMITKHYSTKAEFFENRLVNYIWKNKDTFPQFTNKLNIGCDTDLFPKKDDGYTDITLL